MPSTAKLLAIQSRVKTHAYLPGDDATTLCGLEIMFPPEHPRRFYAGIKRPLCKRCMAVARRVRPTSPSVELREVRHG